MLLHKTADNQFKVDLFINKDKCSDPEVQKYLAEINVTVHAYGEIEQKLLEYGKGYKI